MQASSATPLWPLAVYLGLAVVVAAGMIGLSSLAGAPMYLFPRVVELLEEEGIDNIVVCGGGIIPDEDISRLKEAGIREIFTPGTSLDRIVAWVQENVRAGG